MRSRHAHRSLICAAVVAGALAVPGHAAAPTGTLATNASLGPVAAARGTVAWSAWDPAIARFRLIVRGPSGVPRALAVRPQRSPFAVSAGAGPNGHTWLVWHRCTGFSTDRTDVAPSGCHIVGWDLAHPGEQRIPGASRKGHTDYAPSIDGRRVAFADAPDSGKPARPKLLITTFPGALKVRSVAALPLTSCELSADLRCSPVTTARVWTTALHGSSLAVGASIATTAAESAGICGLSVLRLTDLASGSGRTLGRAICGLSGALMSTAAFGSDGGLWWARTCGGDDGGCLDGRGDPQRIDPATGVVQRLTGPTTRLLSLAVSGTTPVLSRRSPPALSGSCFVQPDGTALGSQAYVCGSVTAIGLPALVPAKLRDPRQPDDGSLPVLTTTRLQVLRPPPRIACDPRRGATLWAGAFTPPTGTRPHPTPAIAVAAKTAGRPAVHARVRRATTYWRYQAMTLAGPAACHRTWTLRYRATATTPAASFSVRVG